MTIFKKNPRRATFISRRAEKKALRAARKAGEQRQRDDERAIFGKIDQSDPYWADRD